MTIENKGPKTRFFRSTLGVFQGGGCRAAAFAGAYEVAISRGARFTEVAGTSAGSIVAALIGAGATPAFLTQALTSLDFGEFLKQPKRRASRGLWGKLASLNGLTQKIADVYFDLGLHSSEYIQVWVERQLAMLLPFAKSPISFSDLILPTWIVATDALGERVHVWSCSRTPQESVAKAVCASCSIPIYFQPIDNRFFDGGVLSNLPTFVFGRNADAERPLSSRVLAFSLKSSPESSSDQHVLMKLVNTIVDGAQDLQLAIQGAVPVLTIPTGDVKATDFHRMSKDMVGRLISSGRVAASEFFDAELGFANDPFGLDRLCYDREEVYSAVVQAAEGAREVLISEHETDFVYSIFPTILHWRLRGVPIRILLNRAERSEHSEYRRRLLHLLGVQVREVDQVPIRAFIINGASTFDGKAIVGVPTATGLGKLAGVVYEGVIDAYAIISVYQQLGNLFEATRPRWGGINDQKIEFRQTAAMRVVDGLRRVAQYSSNDVTIELRRVETARLVSLTRLVREYKYAQIELLSRIYHSRAMSAFGAAEILLGDGLQRSIVTPPVVEENGSKFILIEGTTRATFLRDQGADQLDCFVVKGVRDPLPAEQVEFSRVRVVSKELRPDERYPAFKYSHFRHIEVSVRPIDSLELQ